MNGPGHRLLSIVGSLLVLAGCAAAAPGRSPDTVQAAIRGRGLDPEVILAPFQLSDEMIAWARAAVPAAVPRDQQVERLLEAMTAPGGLALEYESDFTGSAKEVFEQRLANCLSFTHLFVGLARAIGLEAYFLVIDDVETFSREGDLVIRAGHITAAAGPPQKPRILEFSQLPPADYRQLVKIGDLTAIALFYSNRGAEFLRQAKVDDAIWWLERAVTLDPEVADTWVNLGVARRWRGELKLAEASYRRALEVDPETPAAYQNLASLYRRKGDEAAAREILALTNRRDNRNPFTYLQLGDLSLRQGDLAAAERFYRRAARLDPRLATAQAALGQWALAAGEPRSARKHLKLALELDPADARAAQLDRQLGVRQARD